MNAEIKAFQEKVRAQLQQANSQIEEFEARSKAEDKQVAADLISQLRSTHEKIAEKNRELETSAVEEMEEEQAEIDAGLENIRAGLAQLDTKLKRAS
jgi:uncharacterized phage infection (PIP) family protein YhgE